MIIKTERDEVLNYLVDAANFKGNCDIVYIPESIEEVIEIVKYCAKNKIKLTITGNRTSLTGASIPLDGVVLSLGKFNKIIEINEQNRYIITQPAVLLSTLKESVQKVGLFYPADPTEQNCFIGSTVATNASGARTYKFGSTRDFVEELKLIMPNGDKLHLKRGENFVKNGKAKLTTESGTEYSLTIPDIKVSVTKNSAGYYCKEEMDIIDLFIGSEGTLGIIYEIKLKLLKLPDKFFSTVLFFENIDDCFNLIGFFKKKKDSLINPSAIEFMDKNSLNLLRVDYTNIPNNAACCLWIEQDCVLSEYEKVLEEYLNLFGYFNIDTTKSWFAYTDTELNKFQIFRHAIPSKVNEYISRNNFTKLGTDIAVPDEVFNEFYKESIKKVELAKLNYAAYGHFGNSHIHLNMLPKNDEEIKIARQIYLNLCESAIFYKGTISAEHGIGKLKTKFLKLMFEDYIINQFVEIKKTIDTSLILNIGNILEEKSLYEN